jgi:hypothetical protein
MNLPNAIFDCDDKFSKFIFLIKSYFAFINK